MADCIKVLCRFRPQNSREKAANAYIVVRVSDDHTLCEVTHPDKSKQPKPLQFNFDCVFDWTSTQTEVYEHAAAHLVEQVFEGFNATIFAYGQTGAGKTYSMEGKLGSPHRGIVPRTVENIFETIADADETMEYLVCTLCIHPCTVLYTYYTTYIHTAIHLHISYKYRMWRFIWKRYVIYSNQETPR